MTLCEIDRKEADGIYTWGLYDDPNDVVPSRYEMQRVALCSECAKTLWTNIHGAVNELIMHFSVAPTEEIKLWQTSAMKN